MVSGRVLDKRMQLRWAIASRCIMLPAPPSEL